MKQTVNLLIKTVLFLFKNPSNNKSNKTDINNNINNNKDNYSNGNKMQRQI